MTDLARYPPAKREGVSLAFFGGVLRLLERLHGDRGIADFECLRKAAEELESIYEQSPPVEKPARRRKKTKAG